LPLPPPSEENEVVTVLEGLRQRRQEILDAAARRGARNVRVFGSVARGDADPESDIDFLVEFEPCRSLFDQGGLLMDLERLLGRSVDVVTEAGLKERIRPRVVKEALPL
jgi:predicted nucleotidyltransferase